MNVGIEVHVVIYLKITNFEFYVTTSVFIVCSSKQTTFSAHITNHNIDTRQTKNNLFLPQENLTVYKKQFIIRV